MRLALVAVAAIPFVAAYADQASHANHAKRLQHARQAPPASPSGSGSTTAAGASAAHSAGTSTTPGAPPVTGATTTAVPTAAPPNTVSVSVSLLATNPTAVPLASINANAPSAATQPLANTPTAGAVPTSIPSAPGLPNIAALSPANYPALDKVPPTDSPQVQQWIQDVQNSGVKIPDFAPTVAGGCPSNPGPMQDGRCWWTCGGCTRDTDIVECPDPKHWGLTYDDGPAFYTTELLDYLDEKQLKSTFFVVGSRCISFPAILQSEYIAGHQIAVHTWSHPSLTTLTNEQIIAELGWTKKIIKDVLGVTPNMMRPPFGDIDDRVRAISTAMGLTPVMWTRISPMATFDTDDFNIHGGTTTVGQVLQNWQGIMNNVSSRDTGFIVLEHDLFQQTVEVATGYILPDALARGLTIEPVSTCLKRPLADAYIETNDNKTNPPPSGTGANAVPGASPTTNTGGTGAGSNSSAGSSGSGNKGSGAIETLRFGAGGAVVAATSLAVVFAGLFTIF